MRLFGTSGIRRVVDREFLELALKVGLAVGKTCGNVALARDTRTTGEAMTYSILTGLLAAGARATDIGIAPTPTLALAAAEYGAGIMITASHNPAEYNGIKLFNPDGSSFSPEQRSCIERLVAVDDRSLDWSRMGTGDTREGFIEKHIDRIKADIGGVRPLRVVVDCGCGAASVITPELLRQLGCEVIAINSFPSGFFPRNPEPTEANLRQLAGAVKEMGADLGIAHDGDADRMMGVDDRGRFIPGDKLLVLFASDTAAAEVVTTVDASMGIEETGFRVRRTPVGDTYVSEELKNGGEFGGEPSGSWVFPENSLCPDGIYAAARLVRIAGSGHLSETLDEIPAYPLIRDSVPGQVKDIAELEERLLILNPVSTATLDGLKLNFADGWLLVRPSGTEPKMRVTAEGRDEVWARQLCEQAREIISGGTGGGES